MQQNERQDAQPSGMEKRPNGPNGRGMLPTLSLRWRLFIATFGLLAVLFAALGLLITLTFEQTMLQDQAITMRDEARVALTRGGGIFRHPSATPTVGPGTSSGASGSTTPGSTVTNVVIGGPTGAAPPSTGTMSPALQSVLPLLVSRLTGAGTAASVLTPSGDVLTGHDASNVVPPVQPGETTIQTALISPLSNNSYSLMTDDAGTRELVVLLPIVENQHTVGVLELNTPTTSIDRSVASIRLLLFIGIGGSLLIAALVARPLIDAALRPLVQMERASHQIADGALSLRLEEPPTSDEIGRLARSFNVMVARLEAAFTRQKRFVADVSHELRTPLTALSGGIEMLLLGADQQDPADPEAGRRLLRGLYGETERMRRLVADLLTLARLDEGRAQLRISTVNVNTLVSDVCAQAQHLARGQRITSEVDTKAPLARADSDRLRQILLNLVENAVKFTPATGQIVLSTRKDTVPGRHGVRIAVRDTGGGIPAEALPQVFDRFYRVDEARVRIQDRPGGSGLGLAIAKSLIEAQGGAISISSAVGEGTEVVLWLPAADAPRSRPTPTIPRLRSPEVSTPSLTP